MSSIVVTFLLTFFLPPIYFSGVLLFRWACPHVSCQKNKKKLAQPQHIVAAHPLQRLQLGAWEGDGELGAATINRTSVAPSPAHPFGSGPFQMPRPLSATCLAFAWSWNGKEYELSKSEANANGL